MDFQTIVLVLLGIAVFALIVIFMKMLLISDTNIVHQVSGQKRRVQDVEHKINVLEKQVEVLAGHFDLKIEDGVYVIKKKK